MKNKKQKLVFRSYLESKIRPKRDFLEMFDFDDWDWDDFSLKYKLHKIRISFQWINYEISFDDDLNCRMKTFDE